MKKLQLFAPVVLTLLLSASASAGIMETDVAATPPPPPTTAANATVQSDGIMTTGIMTPMLTATDPVTIAVLSVLQSVLARF